MNIRDIAKLCGVSASTISKVLHDDRTISEETRKKVLSVVKAYNYVPYSDVLKNAVPRMNMIAVVLDEEHSFYKELLYGMEDCAFSCGYNIMVCNASEGEGRRKRYLQALENKGINGLIFIGCKDGNPYKLPTVEVGMKDDPAYEENLSQISYDIEEMGYLGVKYLLEQGHRNIACLVKPGEENVKAGCRRACEGVYARPEEEWIFELRENETEDVIGKCIALGASAIFCSDIAYGSLIYVNLQKYNISVPEEISVVCMGNSGLAEHLVPPVTTVEVSAARIAQKAIEALHGMMESQKPGWLCHAQIEPEIVERGSVENLSGKKPKKKFVVVGNVNMDCNVIVDNTRTRGGTLRIKRAMQFPGGEGANQAVGIGKLGGCAYLLGCLGNDREGRIIYNSLTEAGVRTNGVVFCPSQTTGKAYITVGAGGKSTIIIEEGANQCLDGDYVKKYESVFEGAEFCLISMELSEDAVLEALNICREKNVKTIVKPSAIQVLAAEILEKIDYFVPNEEEAVRLVPGDMAVEERAEVLFGKGIPNIVITLGDRGCYLKNKEYARHFATQKFPAVDVTGAADAFISAMAVCLAENCDIVRAIELATYAADVSVTRFGVQQAMIDREGLEAYQAQLEEKSAVHEGR